MTRRKTNPRPHAALTGLGAIAIFAGVGAMAGCRGDRSDNPPRQFFPDMDDQPKLLPQMKTEFFEDGMVERRSPDRTVAWGSSSVSPTLASEAGWAGHIRDDRERVLAADATFAYGLLPGSTREEPQYADFMPVEVTRDLVLRGQERFDIYCSACHGYTGVGGQDPSLGAGTVGRLWSYAPANLLADLYRDRSQTQGKDGYLFHIIRDGLANPDGTYRMPPYGHAVSEQDAWAIVAYVRVLQAAQGVPFEELDAADQARLSPRGADQ
jgi:mono/diheme cytochrome c family protein